MLPVVRYPYLIFYTIDADGIAYPSHSAQFARARAL
jgi:hypothetical protein